MSTPTITMQLSTPRLKPHTKASTFSPEINTCHYRHRKEMKMLSSLPVSIHEGGIPPIDHIGKLLPVLKENLLHGRCALSPSVKSN